MTPTSSGAQGLSRVLDDEEEARRCASLLAKGLAKAARSCWARGGLAEGFSDEEGLSEGGHSAEFIARGGVSGALTCSALVLWLLHAVAMRLTVSRRAGAIDRDGNGFRWLASCREGGKHPLGSKACTRCMLILPSCEVAASSTAHGLWRRALHRPGVLVLSFHIIPW